MKDHELLRINLLRTLLEMEEKLIADVNCGNPTNKDMVDVNTSKEINQSQVNNQLKAVFSVKELSEYLGVSADCIYTMVRERQIPHIRVRRRILFHRQVIDSWILNSKP